MNADDPDPLAEAVRVPIVEERLEVGTRLVDTDRVRVRTLVDERTEQVEQRLRRGQLEVSRIALDREVAEAPAPRQEGDTLIVSVVEERLVKRLFVVEEVRVTRTDREEAVAIPVTLRRTRAVVERDDTEAYPAGEI